MAGTQSSQQQSTAQSTGQSGTYFQDPNLVNQLSNTLGSVGQQSAGQYMNFVSNPTASPLFTNQLNGLLQALQPSEAQSRTALQDSGRAAGMMASGPFANAAALNESNILRNRQTLASQLLGQMFPQMTQALQQPMSLAEQLINALKMQQSSQQSSSQSSGNSSGTQTDPAAAASGSSGTSAAQLLAALMGGGKPGAAGPTSVQTGTQQNTGPTGYDMLNDPNFQSGSQNLQGTDYGYYNPGQQWDQAVPDSLSSTDFGYYNPGQAWDEGSVI